MYQRQQKQANVNWQQGQRSTRVQVVADDSWLFIFSLLIY